MKNVSIAIFLAATLMTVVACGKKETSSSKQREQNLLITEEGRYQATLASLNSHLAGDVSGSATVKVKGDVLTAEVKVNGAPSQIVHIQSIHVANECPTLASDANNDGVIDGVEGQAVYGKVIIPLDNELKTQIEENPKFPRADFTGNYFYRQDVSMIEMLKDLMLKDLDTSDNMVKLDSNLGLAGRQIVIYGVTKETILPETVAATNGQTNYASLPIACGSFIKIADEVGPNTSGGKEE